MAKKYHTVVSSSQPLSGGREMITERRIPCTSGCTYCRSDRKPTRVSDLDFSSQPGGRNGSPSTLDDRLPTPYHFDFKPTPRPEKDRRRDRDRDRDRDHYYGDGARVDDYALRRSNSLHGPSQPIPIPLPPRRSTTVHEDDDRRRESRDDRPRVLQRGHSRRESDDVPLGFYDLLYHHGAGSSSRHADRDRYAVKDPRHPPQAPEPGRTRSHRRRSESPTEVRHGDDGDDDRHRHHRERSSLHRRNSSGGSGGRPRVFQRDGVQPEVIYGSSPLFGSLGSSSHGSSPPRPSTSPRHGASPSPPKSVRWGDDPRAAQNARISSRAPPRPPTGAGAGAGAGAGDAGRKGILRRAGGGGGAAPAAVRDDLDSAGMIEGLRRRINNNGGAGRDGRSPFDMPPRRFSSSSSPPSSSGGGRGGAYGEKAAGRGRRPEAFYDDGRRDWY